MTLKEFIKRNKTDIDESIKQACPNARLNYSERRDWIMNDEGLYRWAQSEGVRI